MLLFAVCSVMHAGVGCSWGHDSCLVCEVLCGGARVTSSLRFNQASMMQLSIKLNKVANVFSGFIKWRAGRVPYPHLPHTYSGPDRFAPLTRHRNLTYRLKTSRNNLHTDNCSVFNMEGIELRSCDHQVGGHMKKGE